MTRSHTWEADAVCARVDPDLWFPAIGESAAPARRLCLTCPVRTECLAAAMAEEAGQHRHGIRGGLTARERLALASRQRQAAA